MRDIEAVKEKSIFVYNGYSEYEFKIKSIVDIKLILK